MRSAAIQRCKEVLALHKVKTNVPALDVGGAPTVVLDNKPGTPNPLRTLSPKVQFLDSRRALRPDYALNFLDAHAVKPLEAKFPLVYCFDTLEHVRNPFKWARHLLYVCKSRGHVYLSTVFKFPIHRAPADYWRFTPDGLRVLFEGLGGLDLDAGWEDERGVYILMMRTR